MVFEVVFDGGSLGVVLSGLEFLRQTTQLLWGCRPRGSLSTPTSPDSEEDLKTPQDQLFLTDDCGTSQGLKVF